MERGRIRDRSGWWWLLTLLVLIVLAIAIAILVLSILGVIKLYQSSCECEFVNCTTPNPCMKGVENCGTCDIKPRPQGYPCNSSCYVDEATVTGASSHQCILLDNCIQCQGSLCKGTCNISSDCIDPARDPLVEGYGTSASCIDGMCVYYQEFSGGSGDVPCQTMLAVPECKKYIAEEYSECMDVEYNCSGTELDFCIFKYSCSNVTRVEPTRKRNFLDDLYLRNPYDDVNTVVHEEIDKEEDETRQSSRQTRKKSKGTTTDETNEENIKDIDKLQEKDQPSSRRGNWRGSRKLKNDAINDIHTPLKSEFKNRLENKRPKQE